MYNYQHESDDDYNYDDDYEDQNSISLVRNNYQTYDENQTHTIINYVSSSYKSSSMLVLKQKSSPNETIVQKNQISEQPVLRDWLKLASTINEVSKYNKDEDIAIKGIGYITLSSKQGRCEHINNDKEEDIETKLNTIYDRDCEKINTFWKNIIKTIPSQYMKIEQKLEFNDNSNNKLSTKNNKNTTDEDKKSRIVDIDILKKSSDSIKIPELFIDDTTDTNDINNTDVEQPKDNIDNNTKIEYSDKLKQILKNNEEKKKRAEQQKLERAKRIQLEIENERKNVGVNSNKKTKANIQLKNFLFNSNNISVSGIKNDICNVYNVNRIMTIYSKLIIQCYNDYKNCIKNTSHSIPLPRISNYDINVASPTGLNIIQTPIIPTTCCRDGVNCQWFKHQAYSTIDKYMPRDLYNANECNFLHVDNNQPLTIDNNIFVNCIVPGCKSKTHYLPKYDSNCTIHVLHVPINKTSCIFNDKSYCTSILNGGCSRGHKNHIPVIISLIMRNEFINQGFIGQWNNDAKNYLYKISRTILETKISKNNNDTIESRFNGAC